MPALLTNRQTSVKRVNDYLCLSGGGISLSGGFNLPIMPPPNRIAELRSAKGLTIEQLAEATGISVSYLSRLATGDRNLSVKNLNKIAVALGVGASDLLTETVIPADQVPVVGYVGAGAENHYYDGGQPPNDYVPMPPGGTDKTVAVEIRGDSLGSVFNNWLVYYDEIHEPPSPDLLRKLCVVGLPDGRVLVKKLMRGSAPGLYNLESNFQSTIEDVTVEWAAPVRTMTPR